MALIPTHIRFAIDVAKHYPISDFQKYISGTVYPDTRWMTGIDRKLTHHQKFLDPNFPNSDFTLGWHIHCVCDELQNRAHEPLFKNLQTLDRTNKWIQLSIAKVIQDTYDLQQFDLLKALEYLDYVENPNNEDIELVRRFYQVVQFTYTNKLVPTPEDYRQFWLDVCLSPKITENLIDQLKVSLQNIGLKYAIEKSYSVIIQSFEKEYC